LSNNNNNNNNNKILYISHEDRKGYRAFYTKKDKDGNLIKVYVDEEGLAK